jgi:hypothetical protein
MKKIIYIIAWLLFLLLVLPIVCFASLQEKQCAVIAKKNVATCTSMAVDVYQQLETVPSSSPWTLTDTGGDLSAGSGAEQSLVGCPNATADTGTKGMILDTSATAEADIKYTLTTATSSVSTGFWVRADSLANYGSVLFVVAKNGNPSTMMRLAFAKAGGTENQNVTITFVDGTPSAGASIPAQGTWYWIMLLLVQNGTSKIQIYDASSNLVSSTSTTSSPNVDVKYLWYGAFSGPSTTGTLSFDDIIIDYTNAACFKPNGTTCTW